MNDILTTILSIISGLIVCIPVVVKLVQSIIDNGKMKNWNILVSYVSQYMAEAEKLYAVGAAKKEWVMEMITKTATIINYDLNEVEREKISAMIDELCDLSKNINSSK